METTTYVPLQGPTSLVDFARRHHPRAAEWVDPFVLSRERLGAAELGKYYRSVKTGELVTVGPGVCLPGDVWSAFSADERYLARLRAFALTARTPVVFGGESGAALWRLPIIGAWPARPVVLGERAGGGRSTPRVLRRCEGMPDEVWVVDHLATTSLALAVVDVARHSAFGVAVPMADRALAPKTGVIGGALAESVSKAHLLGALSALDILHGSAKALA